MKHFKVTFRREWVEYGETNIFAHSKESAENIAQNRLAEDRKIDWDTDHAELKNSEMEEIKLVWED